MMVIMILLLLTKTYYRPKSVWHVNTNIRAYSPNCISLFNGHPQGKTKMMSEVHGTTGWAGLDWHLEEDWGNNCQISLQKMSNLQNNIHNSAQTTRADRHVSESSMPDLKDVEDISESRLVNFLDPLHYTRSHHLMYSEFDNWQCGQTRIPGNFM